jgi:hypothetical protein
VPCSIHIPSILIGVGSGGISRIPRQPCDQHHRIYHVRVPSITVVHCGRGFHRNPHSPFTASNDMPITDQ